MADMQDEELIKIKKRPIKAPKKKANKKQSVPKMRSTPKANGVKLDFTEETPEINRYWLSVSRRYRVARYVSVVLLCAFLLVMLVFYRENITYANLVYLVRDLDSEAAVEVGGYNDIEYSRSTNSDYDIFRSRIAVASSSGFKLYSQTGSVDLESDDVIADPRLEVSEKYALMYGAGEKKYSVFTTVAKVLSAESQFEIEDAALSDSGSYALLTRSRESRFLITVYDDAFRKETEYYKDNFVMDIALSAEGDRLVAVSAKAEATDISCEVMIGTVGTKDTVSFEYSGMMPLSCEYTEDGRCVVLCDSALLIFDKDKEVAKIPFAGLTPGYFDIEKNTVAISFQTNVIGSENTVKVYGTDGKEQLSADVSGKIAALSTDGEEAVYAVTESRAVRISLADKKISEEKTEAQALRAIAVPSGLIVFFPEGSRSFFLR